MYLAQEALPATLVMAAGGRHHAQQPRRFRQVEAVHAAADGEVERAAAPTVGIATVSLAIGGQSAGVRAAPMLVGTQTVSGLVSTGCRTDG